MTTDVEVFYSLCWKILSFENDYAESTRTCNESGIQGSANDIQRYQISQTGYEDVFKTESIQVMK